MGFNEKLWADTRRNTEDIENVSRYNNFHGYNIENGLRRWYAGVAESETIPVFVGCLGDSIFYGTNISDRLTKSIPERLSSSIRTKYGSLGTRYLDCKDSDFTYAGTWNDILGAGMRNTVQATGGVASKVSFTFTGVAFDVFHPKGDGGGIATVKIDGSSVASINMGGTGLLWSQKTSYTGLSNAVHTVEITAPASGTVWFEGIAPYATTKGLFLFNLAVSGANTNYFKEGYRASGILNVNTRLIIIELGTNDYADIANENIFYSNLVEILAKYSSLKCSFLFCVNCPYPAQADEKYDRYMEKYYKLADEYNAAVFSVHSKWGTWEEALLLGFYDGIDAAHPIDLGAYDYALGLASHLIL